MMFIKTIFEKIKAVNGFFKSSKNDYINYKKDIKKFNSRHRRQRILDNEI